MKEPSHERELDGSVAVVTGGSRGIGAAIARELARRGAEILLVARSESDLAATAAAIGDESGRRVEICPTDLRTPAGCEVVAAALAGTFGAVDILVNGAGDTRGGPFLELEDATWQAGFDLKFWSAVRLCRLLWPQLADRRGTVINIVGGFARTPSPDMLIGGAVNAALANFTKGLAGQGLRDDVNVNAVHPGPTLTDRMERMFADRADREGITAAEMKQQFMNRQGVRRLGEVEDVANLVAFLCSPQARHIQGVAIAVDGGGTSGVY